MELTITARRIKNALTELDAMDFPCYDTAHGLMTGTDEELTEAYEETLDDQAHTGEDGYEPWFAMIETIKEFRARYPDMLFSAGSYLIGDLEKLEFVHEITG